MISFSARKCLTIFYTFRQYFHSPLENNVLLGELVIKHCRVMDTAKKPLWLVWENPDPLADVSHAFNSIIFKNGDDLR